MTTAQPDRQISAMKAVAPGSASKQVRVGVSRSQTRIPSSIIGSADRYFRPRRLVKTAVATPRNDLLVSGANAIGRDTR
jgi:hypothetical protein